VDEGRFHIWSVQTVAEGIELLSGKPAGKRKADGTYTKNSVNDRVDRKLRELAEGLKRFGSAEPEEKQGGKSGGRKSGGKKKA
jgi:ATP-dependent Lon protease